MLSPVDNPSTSVVARDGVVSDVSQRHRGQSGSTSSRRRPQELSQGSGGEDQWIKFFVVPEFCKVKPNWPCDLVAILHRRYRVKTRRLGL